MSAEPAGNQDRVRENAPPSAEASGFSPLEGILMREALISEAQILRARKILERMRVPKPISEVLVDLGQLTRSEHERILKLRKAQLTVAEILHESGAMDAQELELFRAARVAGSPSNDTELLVNRGVVTERAYLQAVSSKYDIPYMEPEAAVVDDALFSSVSFPYLKRHRVLPFRIIDDKLTVIMADPLDGDLIAQLEEIFERKVQVSCAPSADIQQVLDQMQARHQGQTLEDEPSTLRYREIHDVTEDEEIGAEAVRIVDSIFFRAIGMGASDVHIEPRENSVRVRVRVDGVLRPLTELPGEFAPRVAARIKVLCGADLAERRLHQDGRIFVRVEGREIDMRVSTYASVFGETVVVRILDRRQGLHPFDGLGFEPATARVVRETVLRAPSGLVLVTGPTGSGKTTTLYSFVDAILDGHLKVITCEDPVEYVLEGTTQCHINMKHGPTYADSLRAMMRQDPDVIVVGEVRDGATAQLAVEASLTGHKVLSSFHTEDSVGAMVRLLDMGVEPFLVSSTVSCVIAQRLVRRTCPECATKVAPSKRDLRYLGVSRAQLGSRMVSEGQGCDHCGGSGFKGRAGVHEVLVPNDDFRDAVLQRAPSRELRELAKKLPGFVTLQEAGILKVVQGVTTLAEIADQVPRDFNPRSLAMLKELTSRRGMV